MKRIPKRDVISNAEEQISVYSKCQDPESYKAIEVARNALVFLRESKRKVFSIEEANALLDW